MMDKNDTKKKATGRPDISLVVPCYDEEESLPRFLREVVPVLEGAGVSFEILFVDDGSMDRTPELIEEAAQADPRIRGLQLSRNFGKEAALSAGLDHVWGRAVIPMDVDLQDPPSLLPEMIALWKQGYASVLAVREKRSSDTFFKRTSARLFYKLIRKVSSVNIVENAGDFRLMDRKVVDVVRRMPERNRFMKGMLAWPGFSMATVSYHRQERVASTSKWTYWKLWNFALSGIFGFSSIPLRLWTYLGGLVALGSLIWAFWVGLSALIHGIKVVHGITTTTILVLFMNSLVMIGIGVVGEYIARIFEEVKQRPVYVVMREINGAPERGAESGQAGDATAP